MTKVVYCRPGFVIDRSVRAENEGEVNRKRHAAKIARTTESNHRRLNNSNYSVSTVSTTKRSRCSKDKKKSERQREKRWMS